MARRNQDNAFGGAVGGTVDQTTPARRQGGGRGGGGRRHHGSGPGTGPTATGANGNQGDPNNPYNSGDTGNLTTGMGSDNANENPDDYWTWAAAKAGLNVNPTTPFGGWMGKENDYYQQLFGAYKLDHPSAYFSNFLGGYGWGSPTQPDPAPIGNGKGAKPDQTDPAAADQTGGRHRHRGGRR